MKISGVLLLAFMNLNLFILFFYAISTLNFKLYSGLSLK